MRLNSTLSPVALSYCDSNFEKGVFSIFHFSSFHYACHFNMLSSILTIKVHSFGITSRFSFIYTCILSTVESSCIVFWLKLFSGTDSARYLGLTILICMRRLYFAIYIISKLTFIFICLHIYIDTLPIDYFKPTTLFNKLNYINA